MTQLALLAQSKASTLWQIERVPDRLALAHDRFYLTAKQGEASWTVPLQLTELEARSLLPQVERFEIDPGLILRIVEPAIGGGAL